MLAQNAWKVITGRADDRLAGDNVLIHAMFGAKHSFNLVDRDGDGHPVASVRAREGGSGVDVVVGQPNLEGLDRPGARRDELVNFLFRWVVSVSEYSRSIRGDWARYTFSGAHL